MKQTAGELGLRWGAARTIIRRGPPSCAQLPAFWHGLSGAVSASRAGDGTELLVFESRLDRHALRPGMTLAEREVLHAVSLGLDHREIAVERQTSARTAANRLASLFRKFGVTSKAERAARALSLDSLRLCSTSPGARGARSALATVRAHLLSAED